MIQSLPTSARITAGAVAIVAVIASLYHLTVAYPAIGAPRSQVHLPLHLSFVFSVLFGDSAVRGLRERRYLHVAWDVLMIVMVVSACIYLMMNGRYISNRFTYAQPLLPVERILSIALLIAILDAARRTVGWVLVVLTLLFILYAMVGNFLPGIFYHQGFTSDRILEQTYMTEDGVWSSPVSIAASFIFLFVLFGTLLLSSGAGAFFTDLARAATGRSIGGPAKTAVVASAMMGMLSGSAAANVVTTGSFTIPAMKRAGYRPEFAAGVEAVASTGGQLTPPLLGAAAFLMIEFIGVSYSQIITFSIIPAFLYFLAVFAMVDLEARRIDLYTAPDEILPRIGETLRRGGYLVLPVFALVFFLYRGYTASAAGFWAIASLVVLVTLFSAENRRRMPMILWEALVQAPRLMATVTTACAVGGILAGVIVMTNLGANLSTMILQVAGSASIVALVLTMCAAIVLGMGMPTASAYIILATLLGPGLTNLGIEPVAAHMFIIYCAAMSGITPPVAISSFAAAAIAGTDPWKTSLTAIRIGISVWIVPYMFVYGPALLGIGTPSEVAITLVSAVIGVVALSITAIGWFRLPLRLHERAVSGIAAIFMIFPGSVTDIAGICAGLLFLTMVEVRRRRPTAAVSQEPNARQE